LKAVISLRDYMIALAMRWLQGARTTMVQGSVLDV